MQFSDSTANTQRLISSTSKRGRPKKTLKNSLHSIIQEWTINDEYPSDFIDVTTGAVTWGVGADSTRPLSRRMLVSVLRRQPVIAAEAIARQLECSLRHAQRIAVACRVVVHQLSSKYAEVL